MDIPFNGTDRSWRHSSYDRGVVPAVAQHLQQWVANRQIAGLSIAVQQQGVPVWAQGFGRACLESGQEVDPAKTLFRVASISKPIMITALAVMVAEGDLDLDSSLYRYMPHYPKKQWDFTIGDLAGHTAGFRAYQGMEMALNKPYTIQEGLDLFQDAPLLYMPGTDFLYNSFGFVLLACLIEQVSGKGLHEYIAEKVLHPLGMDHTFPEWNPNNPHEEYAYPSGQKACCYRKGRSGFQRAFPVNNAYKLGGGGYLSTALDINRLGQSWLEGSLFSKTLSQRFLTETRVQGKGTSYGMGWELGLLPSGSSWFGHLGTGIGGYGKLWVFPEEQKVLTILTNTTTPKIDLEMETVASLLVGSLQ